MKYNNGFNINEIFSDEKYRARFMLAIYGVVFLSIIIFIRVNNKTVDSQNKNTQNNVTNTENVENTTNNSNTENEENSGTNDSAGQKINSNVLTEQFSFFSINNYHFNYIMDIGEKISIDGERYDNKIHFVTEAVQSNKKLEYFGNKQVLKVKLDDSYEYADYPYLYINIFDTNTLYNIIKASYLISRDDDTNVYNYKISNTDLSEFVSDDYYLMINRDDSIYNEIVVTLVNNKVAGIDVDFTNLLSSNSEVNKLVISMKYDKFAQIIDFNVDF